MYVVDITDTFGNRYCGSISASDQQMFTRCYLHARLMGPQGQVAWVQSSLNPNELWDVGSHIFFAEVEFM